MAYSFLQTATNNASATTYTFTAQSLGAADSTRIVIVAAMVDSGSAATISAITVGGVSATIDHSYAQTRALAIARADVPSGTTGDVVVTSSASGTRCAIALWRVTGVTLALADHDESVAAPGTITLTPGGTGDYVFAAARGDATGGGTWTGATEDFDVVVESLRSFSGASLTTSSGSDVTVGVTFGATTREVAVSYTPTDSGGTPGTFTADAGAATASGGTLTMAGAASFTAATATASAAGVVVALSGAATFATAAGVASAAGGTVTMSAASGATFTVTAAQATATGGTVALSGAARFALIAGTASAAGGTVAMQGGASATFTATTGAATASGGVVTLTGQGVFSVLAAAATATGGNGTFTGAATFATGPAASMAAGGVLALVNALPVPSVAALERTLPILAEARTLRVPHEDRTLTVRP